MKDSSLTRRILVASVSWIVAALVLTALMLLYFDWDHTRRIYDRTVLMHLEEMADQVLEPDDVAQQRAPHPTDRRFDTHQSGWYWEVRRGDEVVYRSESLGDETLDLSTLPVLQPGVTYSLGGPWAKQLRMQALVIPAGPGQESLRLVATAPVEAIWAEVMDIAEHTAASFVLLAVVLVVALVLQLRVALRPLHAVSAAVERIREGEDETLSGSFPREVRPLVDQLNNLIEHSAVVARRARNRLGDLAHSIKNPLTALNNEAYNMSGAQRELVLEQTRCIEDSLKHHLARARVFGTDKVLGARTPIKPLVEDLTFLMQRVHGARGLTYDISGLGNCCFRGDAQDLEEMLGNLMDNAGKWAASRVTVHCHSSEERLHLTVEDDGPGIPADRVASVLHGVQLDPSIPGQGRGLGIVRDVVEMYGGKLSLDRSSFGGLRAVLSVPGAWSTC